METDTLITCKPKMVSIVSINCKFGATECSARVYESLRCLQIWGHSGSKGPKKKTLVFMSAFTTKYFFSFKC